MTANCHCRLILRISQPPFCCSFIRICYCFVVWHDHKQNEVVLLVHDYSEFFSARTKNVFGPLNDSMSIKCTMQMFSLFDTTAKAKPHIRQWERSHSWKLLCMSQPRDITRSPLYFPADGRRPWNWVLRNRNHPILRSGTNLYSEAYEAHALPIDLLIASDSSRKRIITANYRLILEILGIT